MVRLLKFLSTAVFLLASVELIASDVVHKTFQSKTLDRSYVYNLYLPDGYQDSDLRYPVLYLLHGNLGTENSWVGPGNIQQTADELIAAGKIQPQIIVVPADPKFWWADAADDKSLTAFVHDLLPHIDASYRTLSSREGRVIGGYSAGGFGTVNIALQYPELFAAAAALSPAVYAPVPPGDSSAMRQDTFLTQGKFDPSLWESMNWVSFIDEYKSRGIIVPFYINTGDHDRFDIAYYAAVFYQALREHQPDYTELRIFDGDHNFAAWGATVGNAMEYMSQFLSPPQ